MRGYCKCDLCGKTYHEDENKMYDGKASRVHRVSLVIRNYVHQTVNMLRIFQE